MTVPRCHTRWIKGIFAMAALLNGCGAKESNTLQSSTTGGKTGSCEQGITRECVGPGACRGAQSCQVDLLWSACDCGSAVGAGGANTGGSSNSTVVTGSSVTTGGVPATGGAAPTGGVSAAGGAFLGTGGTVGIATGAASSALGSSATTVGTGMGGMTSPSSELTGGVAGGGSPSAGGATAGSTAQGGIGGNAGASAVNCPVYTGSTGTLLTPPSDGFASSVGSWTTYSGNAGAISRNQAATDACEGSAYLVCDGSQRMAAWDGPSLDVVAYLIEGHQYVVTLAVRLGSANVSASATSVFLNAALTCEDKNVATTYAQLQSRSIASTDGWQRFSGGLPTSLAGCSQLARLTISVATSESGFPFVSLDVDDFQLLDVTR